jgi:hypothetical protein
MIRLCGLRWRKRNSPSDILVGKVNGAYLWISIERNKVGPDDVADLDSVYATVHISSRKPYDGPDLPEEQRNHE